MKRVLKITVGLALVTLTTAVANAALVGFTWVPDNSLTLQPTSGSLTYDTVSGAVSSFSWYYDSFANPDTSFSGTATLLVDGNLKLVGTSTGTSPAPTTDWYSLFPLGAPPNADENYFNVHADGVHPAGPGFGNWAPVPEPTTIIGGALLLLPFGLSTLRLLRRNRTA
jgi:hypothetical protein